MASNRIDIDMVRPSSFAQRVVGRFFRGYAQRLVSAAERGTRIGLEDVMDDWKRLSTDLAPLSEHGGTLRRGIYKEVDEESGELTGAISVTAVESRNGKTFDYATHIHDVFPHKTFKHPTTAGTIPKFLDKPLEENGKQWIRDIEKAIRAEFKRGGF